MIQLPIVTTFILLFLGLLTFSIFLLIFWIAIRFVCWPLQYLWYSIKELMDNKYI